MDEKLCIFQFQVVTLGVISTVCPKCFQAGTFDPMDGISGLINLDPDKKVMRWEIGFRKCPNPACSQLILSVLDRMDVNKKIIIQWPPSRINLEAQNVPENIVDTLKESIECHANKCDRAAAAMVRRTLEEICDDKGVEGKDLFDRIEALKSQVVIAPALFEAMHEIRFLGNDAVHIELKWFDDVGEEELSVAIKLTIKIIEAIYQSDDLVNQLKALKKPPATT